MSRDDGFPIADVDTGLFSDVKVKALARRLKDPHLTAEYLCLYVSVLLDSWGEGEPVSFVDAAPAWYTDDIAKATANLEAVGLLEDGHLPPDSWSRWFTPAFERREKRRESGRQGGYAKARSGDAMATLEQRNGTALPVRPSVPTVRPMKSSPAAIEFRDAIAKGDA